MDGHDTIRAATISRLRRDPHVPVLIVGAGINGVGVFRELALQGIDALLIERDDIAAGASSAPSRMIHGGLRYLENRETRLVRESLKERNLLLRNAPHYVKPLATTIPVYDWLSGLWNAGKVFLGLDGKSVNRGALLVKIGLSAYDWYTRRERTMPRHYLRSRQSALRFRPELNPAIVATATYHDAWISYPERLCVELVNDALACHDAAAILNYCTLEGKDGPEGVALHDGISGLRFTVYPQLVVNATGAWVDVTNHGLQAGTNFIGGTKGSHLVIDNPALYEATKGEMLFYENAEGRICILFPIHGKVLVGSTDVRIQHPDEAVCEDWEVDYMVEAVRQVFPHIVIDRSEIVFRFCGVRPLPSSEAHVTARISRDHSIRELDADPDRHYPVYSLVGGKWTTFRAFAELVAAKVASHLDKPFASRSETMPIGGGKDFPETAQATEAWLMRLQTRFPGIDGVRGRVLLERYGTLAIEVCRYCADGNDRPLVHLPDYTVREIEYLILFEHVQHLDDLLLRRTVIAFTGRADAAVLEELAHILCRVNGTAGSERKEIDRTKELLYKNHQLEF